MAAPYRYDLHQVGTTLYRYRRLIIVITICSAIAGLLLASLRTKRYQAETEFFLKNPFYSDRNFLYNNESKFLDYFANEDDVNRLILLAESDSVQQEVIQRFDLLRTYKVEGDKEMALFSLRKQLAGNLKIVRTPSKSLLLRYTDTSAARSAAIANYYVAVLDNALRGFYNDTRMSMRQSILVKITEEDSSIAVLTDSLVALRDKYSIYDIVSPARSNIIVSNVKYTGKPGFAEGLEEIQNLESIKDQTVSNRAWHIALASQYTTGTKMNELPLTKIIRTAAAPLKANGPGRITSAIICAITGFGFSVLFSLIMAYNKNRSASV
ncbi:hypothetical protein [Polluticoccus soli]|uniref:hypothetical protein n=1 Tax=Polluticoccus soli TaxID=3034150 RepID=UPI0023E16D65|nr:hypothetical protein [Flavipsychrobacter sp. JY13-12]